MLDRAYSILEVKSIDDEQRIIRGIATTPTPDREKDIVEPLGLKFAKSIPLFLYHDSRMSVGTVRLGTPSKSGVPFEATIPKVTEAGNLRDRVDEAWHLVKYRLITAVSIGFKPVLEKIEQLKNGGLRYPESEILELSLVPIGMNAEATITAIKSIDEQSLRASSGDTRRPESRAAPPPGATGNKRTGPEPVFLRPEQGKSMNIQEQITSWTNKRAAAAAAAAAIVDKSTEDGATLNAEQKEEYQGFKSEIGQIDDHLAILRDHEKTMVAKAERVEVTAGTTGEQAQNRVNGGDLVLRNNTNLPKGIGLARYVKALAYSKGNNAEAQAYAKQWDTSTPEVTMALKTAIAAGTTQDSTWAGPLVYNANLASEFLDYLRPQTILGKLQGLHHVPFNIRFATQTAGSTVGWVGEGLGKPVSKLQFSSASLGFAKAAGIVVITQELARYSSPSAELVVRNDLAAQMRYFLDQQFIDPGVAAVANVNPASVLNGASNVVQANASGWTTQALVVADVKTFLNTFSTNEIAVDANTYWVMTPGTALTLSLLMTAGGENFAFPGITVSGGTFLGLPVIVSNSVPHSTSAGAIIALIKADEILMADEGGIAIDVSTEASLLMDSVPTTQTSATPTGSSVVSMFQTNSLAIRCERVINWARRRAYGVGYIDNVH